MPFRWGEKVVDQEPVAVGGRLFRDLRAAGRRVPDERRRLVKGTRDGGETVEWRPEAAAPADFGLPPEMAQQRVVLQGQWQAHRLVLPEPWIDGRGVAPAEHQVHSSQGEVLEQCVLLSQPDRIVGRDQRRGGR